jgi:hypothetical protein
MVAVQIELTGRGVNAGQQTLGSLRVAGVADGHMQLNGWNIMGNVGSIALGAAKGIDLHVSSSKANPGNLGSLTVANGLDFSHVQTDGSLNNVSIGSAKSSLLEVGHNVGTFLSRGGINSTSLISEGNINSITAGYWHKGEVQADRITRIVTTGVPVSSAGPAAPGDFFADVTVSGEGVAPNANALGAVSIAGLLHDSVWRINSNAGSFSVGAVSNSSVFVGVDPIVPAHELVDSASLFSNPYATLGSFVVTGRGVSGATTPSFTNSRIAAGILRNVALKYIDTTVEQPNGFVAVSGIGNYLRRLGPEPRDVITVRNQTEARTYDPLLGTPPTGGYVLKIVAYG